MVRQAVRRRPAGLTLGCAPPGVWVLRGHPVAGNSAPGLPLFSVVFIGGCSGASIGKRDRKRPSQTRKSEHHGGCSASLNGGPCPFSLALFAAPARNRGAKKNPGPAPMPSSAGDCTPSRPRRRAERAPGQRRPAARSGPVAFFLVLTCGRRSPAPTRCRCWTCSAPGSPDPRDCWPRRRAGRAPGRRRPAAAAGRARRRATPDRFGLLGTSASWASTWPTPARCRCWTCPAPGDPDPCGLQHPAGHVGEPGEHLADAGPLPGLVPWPSSWC